MADWFVGDPLTVKDVLRFRTVEAERDALKASNAELVKVLKTAVDECPECDGRGKIYCHPDSAETLPCDQCLPWRDAIANAKATQDTAGG